MLINTCGYEMQSTVSTVCAVTFATVGLKELCVLASVMCVCVVKGVCLCVTAAK